MPKKERHNLYTALKKSAKQGPHKETGNNNLYSVLGLKPKKTPTKYKEPRKSNKKVKF